MKWFSIGFGCLLCSTSLARGDAAADLYNRAVNELAANEFDAAEKDFDKIVSDYPSYALADDSRLRAGYSYLSGGRNPEAVNRLLKLVAPDAKPQYRGPALYFTALAQFSQAQKSTGSESESSYTQAIATLTTLIDVVTKAPTPDTKEYLEPAIYYRSLANLELKAYDAAEKDLINLTTSPQFAPSLTKPDYFMRLGGLYAQEANNAVAATPPDPAVIQGFADKAIAAFDQVSRDPNALVQANDANMSKAQVLFLIAQLDASGGSYQKALDAFRLVRRKADMVPLQEERIRQLQKRAGDIARANANAGAGALPANDISSLIQREQARLKDLQDEKTPDPIIQALVSIAECYVTLKQPDEARTIFHRLKAHAKLTDDQQQTVDFQTLYSYVLGGQTDAADAALTDYLAKHTGDPKADFISFSIAGELLKRAATPGLPDDQKKTYLEGALKQVQRSLHDFAQGKYAAAALGLEAEVLNRLGRRDEADKVIDGFVQANPTSPVAMAMILTRAQTLSAKGDSDGALAAYKQVRDNSALPKDTQAAAGAGYIQTLNALQKYDQVLTEAKAYQAKFGDSKSLPNVLLFAGMAMDQKKDPTAVAALQDLARKYPDSDVAPFALNYVVTIYAKAAQPNLPAIMQAANELQKAFPQAYPFLAQAADTVSGVLVKAKRFDDAVALYQALLTAPNPEIVAAARNKIGEVWVTSAKSIHYQSLPVTQRPEAEKRLAAAEQAYTDTLKSSSDQLSAVGDAFDGLVNTAKIRRSWGLLKEADLEGYLDKTVAGASGEMLARLELAKAGLVMIMKDGAKQYPAALDRMKKVIADNPSLKLTRQETDQFGDLLVAAKDYPTATKIYNDLLQNAPATDRVAQADANYGLGATALAQGDVDGAKQSFIKMQNALWHPHIMEAKFGIALADEKSTSPADLDLAKKTYLQLMQVQGSGGVALQAKAMLGYGRLLDKSGNGTKPTAEGPSESAVHYYVQPDTLFGPATPEESAEGLYQAAQLYTKAGDTANAKIMNDKLKGYSATAPDWGGRAQ